MQRMFREMKVTVYLRHGLRRVGYSRYVYPVLRKFIESAVAGARSHDWDQDLSTRFVTYLEPTVSVLTRAHLIAALTRGVLGEGRSALDLGCGAGYQAETLHGIGYQRYVGIDIAQTAVNRAREVMSERREHFPPDCRFETGSIEATAVDGVGEGFDLVIFSEVLYYVDSPSDAVRLIGEFAKALAPGGAIAVSMKNDAKSRTIFSELSNGYDVVRSVLFQEQLGRPRFKVRYNRERPAYLITILQPRVSHREATV